MKSSQWVICLDWWLSTHSLLVSFYFLPFTNCTILQLFCHCVLPFIICLFIMYFVAHSWFLSQAHLNNTRAQKWLAIAHYRIGVSTQSTLRGAKHFNAPTITSFTHHHTGIRQWERNEGILTSNFEVNSWQKKVKNKSDGGAHWRTEACKLCRSRFQMFCNASSMRPTVNCFSELKAGYVG